MKITEVTLSGFQSFGPEPVTVNLDSPGITIISGHNGSGKSSVIDAIDWCLFGSTRGDLANSVVGKGGVAEVTTTFSVSGDEFKVTRIRRDNKSRRKGDPPNVELKVWKNGEKVRAGNVSETGTYISETTGMDERDFHALVSVPQSAMVLGTGFTAASPEGRRDVLMSLVPGLDEWESIEKKVSEEVSQSKEALRYAENRMQTKKQDVERLMSRLREVETQRDNYSMWNGTPVNQAVADARARMSEIDDAIRAPGEARASLKEELSTLSHERVSRNRTADSRRSLLENALSEVQSASNQIASSKEEISTLSDRWNSLGRQWQEANNELPSVIEEGKRVEGELSSCSEKVSELRSEISRIRGLGEAKTEQLSTLMDLNGSPSCPTCGAPVNREHVEQHAADIRSEIESLRSQLNSAQSAHYEEKKRYDNLSSERDRLLGRVTELRNTIASTQQQGQNAKKQADYARSAISNMEQRISQVEERVYPNGREEGSGSLWSTMSQELNSIPEAERESQREIEIRAAIEKIDSRSDLAQQRAEVKSQLEELESGLAEYNSAEGIVSEVEEQIRIAESEVAELEETYSELSVQHDDLVDAKQAASPKGIPDMLLTSTVQRLEDKFNDILAMTDHSSGGPMRVRISQERELASREGTKKVIDIITYGGNSGERDVKMLSGGERVRVTISALLAMVQLVNERRENNIETLIMDEPLGHLDTDNVSVIMALLHKAVESGVVSSITLVSHNTDVIESAARNLVVSRDDSDGFSSVEEI